MRVRISQLAAFRALTKFARSLDLPSSETLLRLNVVHVTCYATSSYVIHFTGAPSFGEAQRLFWISPEQRYRTMRANSRTAEARIVFPLLASGISVLAANRPTLYAPVSVPAENAVRHEFLFEISNSQEAETEGPLIRRSVCSNVALRRKPLNGILAHQVVNRSVSLSRGWAILSVSF
jgi:hypothetical protein